MNAEQKQQAKQLIADWTNVSRTSTPAVWFLNGDCMAGFLQELVDSPEPEPVAFQVRNGWASVAIYQRQIDAENYAKDQQKRHDLSGSLASFCVVPLYTAPPAPSVPDGWMRAIDEALVVHHIDIADSSDGYEEAKKKLNELLAINSDIARDCSEPPADVARDAERYRWLREERFDKPYAVTNEHMNAVYEGDDLDKAIDAAIERQGGE